MAVSKNTVDLKWTKFRPRKKLTEPLRGWSFADLSVAARGHKIVRIIFGNCHSPPGDEAGREVMIVQLAPQKGALLERGSDGMGKVCMEYVKIVKPQNTT